MNETMGSQPQTFAEARRADLRERVANAEGLSEFEKQDYYVERGGGLGEGESAIKARWDAGGYVGKYTDEYFKNQGVPNYNPAAQAMGPPKPKITPRTKKGPDRLAAAATKADLQEVGLDDTFVMGQDYGVDQLRNFVDQYNIYVAPNATKAQLKLALNKAFRAGTNL